MEIIIIGTVALLFIISAAIAIYTWKNKPTSLPQSTIDNLLAFERKAKGMPISDALKALPSYLHGWKVVTFDVTHGGEKLQAWLSYKPGVVDTVAIQYIKGKVDNVQLGPGMWRDPRGTMTLYRD